MSTIQQQLKQFAPEAHLRDRLFAYGGAKEGLVRLTVGVEPLEDADAFLERLGYDPTPNAFGSPGVLRLEVHENLDRTAFYGYAIQLQLGETWHVVFVREFTELLEFLEKMVPLASWGTETLSRELAAQYGVTL